jgi:hypothetical protein
MPCQVTWEERGVYQRLFGFVSAREYSDSIQTIQSDARFDDLRHVIVNCSELTGDDFTDENLGEIAILGHVAHLSNVNCPVAFVVTSARLAELIRRNFVDELQGIVEIAVVPSVREARDWIEVFNPSHRDLLRKVF